MRTIKLDYSDYQELIATIKSQDDTIKTLMGNKDIIKIELYPGTEYRIWERGLADVIIPRIIIPDNTPDSEFAQVIELLKRQLDEAKDRINDLVDTLPLRKIKSVSRKWWQ